jgi:regulator of replication initiation timing
MLAALVAQLEEENAALTRAVERLGASPQVVPQLNRALDKSQRQARALWEDNVALRAEVEQLRAQLAGLEPVTAAPRFPGNERYLR